MSGSVLCFLFPCLKTVAVVLWFTRFWSVEVSRYWLITVVAVWINLNLFFNIKVVKTVSVSPLSETVLCWRFFQCTEEHYEGKLKREKKKQTLLQAEIGWWTIGCPAKGKRGFGVLKERGRNLVPAKTINQKSWNPKISNEKKTWILIRNQIPLVGPPTIITATTFSELSINKAQIFKLKTQTLQQCLIELNWFIVFKIQQCCFFVLFVSL